MIMPIVIMINNYNSRYIYVIITDVHKKLEKFAKLFIDIISFDHSFILVLHQAPILFSLCPSLSKTGNFLLSPNSKHITSRTLDFSFI